MVRRFVGNFVGPRGELLEEGDLLTEEDMQPMVCPYRTVGFNVYRWVGREGAWEEVGELGDERAVLVGGGETVMVKGCRGNSVHFTDDNWEEMNCDHLYGGHDIRVYSLKEERVVHDFSEMLDCWKIDPPPFWLIPNPL